MKRIIRQPFVNDRQVQGVATDTAAAVKDLYSLIPPPRPARIMPVDEATDLFWPLSEPLGFTSFGNFGFVRRRGDRLIPGATCGPSLGGLVEDGCAVMWGTAPGRGATGATSLTGTSPASASLSAWVRLGDPGTGGAIRIIGGYYDAVASAATMVLYLDASGAPTFSVYTGAGQRTVSGVESMRLYPGTWHFLTGVYSGTALGIYLDGLNANSAPAAYSPLVWALAATPPAWRIGFPGSNNAWVGAIQDFRMHSVVRPLAWNHEAWRRGLGLWEEEAP